jgi:cytochrome c556
MKKKLMRSTVLLLSLLTGVAVAVTEVDMDLMQKIEESTKSVDSNISLKDGKAALADAREIEEMFSQVELFYKHKGDAADAIEYARKSKNFATELIRQVSEKDFDNASATVGALAKSCKTCHQVYKKS